MKKQNKNKKKPIISCRSNLSQEALGYVESLADKKEKSKFINQAIEQRYFFLTNKRQFLINIIKEDFKLCRFLLRKIGGENGNKRS